MRSLPLRLLVGLALCSLALAAQRKKNVEPKSEVLPLPPEPPMALAADTQSLDFHISPLLTTGGLAAQIRHSLNNLIRDTRGETIVKLRAFVAGTGDPRQVQSVVVALFTEHKLPLPVLSILQVGSLGVPASEVVIEAVVATGRTLNRDGLAFFAGQNGGSVDEALQRLKASTEKAGVAADHLLSTTCFAAEVSDYSTSVAKLHATFPNSSINLVQAVRDPADGLVMCEAVGQLGSAVNNLPVDHVQSAGVTLVRSPRLVFTGLQLSFGSYLNDAQEAFARLERTAEALSPTETPVEVSGYSLDSRAASALRRTNSLAPGLFTVQTIEGLSALDATGAIEAILAPGVGTVTTTAIQP